MTWLDQFYRSAKPLIFRLDAEAAHGMAFRGLKTLHTLGMLPHRLVEKPKTVFGMSFLNDVGLAAGFDKNAEWLPLLPSLGFGFAEIGTVTPRPQAGNPKPRLFRFQDTQSLFNRMGFNNEGGEVISKRLREAKKILPEWFRVGVNIGKNKDTPNERAYQDYETLVAQFHDSADFFVINVSSPNTPGLRSLQTSAALERIVCAVQEINSRQSKT